MGEIVNLRRVKKARQKAEDAVQAAANRVRHGRTRGEREAEEKEADRVGQVLDGGFLEGEEPS